MKTYVMRVRDPETDQQRTFVDLAPRREAAESAARHAWTGMLGGPSLERVRDRLEVSTIELDVAAIAVAIGEEEAKPVVTGCTWGQVIVAVLQAAIATDAIATREERDRLARIVGAATELAGDADLLRRWLERDATAALGWGDGEERFKLFTHSLDQFYDARRELEPTS